MERDWIVPGVPVWYASSPGDEYAGVVDSEPRLLGGHTWVVNLREMEPRYRNGSRTTVPAAACHAIRARAEHHEADSGREGGPNG